MVSKSSIFGFGVNLQACADMVFVGLSDSFEEIYQSVRRCYRFGQKREVSVHIVIGEAEGAVLRNIRRKEEDADRLASEMVRNMAGLQGATATENQRSTYSPAGLMSTPQWLWGGQ